MAETSLARMIAILDLFKSPRAAWTADAIASAMDYSIPTVYRYVRELVACGLLRRDVGATFVLGPAATELDYHIRTGDPLIIGAAAPMAALAAQTGMDAVLATICGARIITVHHELGAEPARMSFGRGRRMPMFRGAMSLCILAALPRAQLRKLHEESGAEAADMPWETLLAEVKQLRRQGYAYTEGALDPGLAGLALPFTEPERHIVASLGLVSRQPALASRDRTPLLAALQDCARRIHAALAEVPTDAA
ncbi:IclR family transcriptional regulator [Bordetella hinzii]|uniref:IclR family transcriptional regulator n=1 Tax=Bordetella hinzii TaxID=103855 RepID=UPI001153F5D1|nr:IclR family transcriptional regulator C-terminal domain-containing protein [Bordetella hinzii]QDJ31308.1 IclR family transcriptional regulator [Bordetella hinzii]